MSLNKRLLEKAVEKTVRDRDAATATTATGTSLLANQTQSRAGRIITKTNRFADHETTNPKPSNVKLNWESVVDLASDNDEIEESSVEDSRNLVANKRARVQPDAPPLAAHLKKSAATASRPTAIPAVSVSASTASRPTATPAVSVSASTASRPTATPAVSGSAFSVAPLDSRSWAVCTVLYFGAGPRSRFHAACGCLFPGRTTVTRAVLSVRACGWLAGSVACAVQSSVAGAVVPRASAGQL